MKLFKRLDYLLFFFVITFSTPGSSATPEAEKSKQLFRTLYGWLEEKRGASIPIDREMEMFESENWSPSVTLNILKDLHETINSSPPASPEVLKKGSASPILVWNRKTQAKEEEHVYGDALIRWVYGTHVGQKLADHVLSNPWLSRFYGYYQSSFLSGHKVDQFIQQFDIPMQEFSGAPFYSFNDFFVRKFKSEARKFVQPPKRMPAFAEGRYLGYDRIQEGQRFPVKGHSISAAALLGRSEPENDFNGGPLLIARLNPTDYHRFHFPDDGKLLTTYVVHGSLQSVNPIALKYNDEILIQNERQVSILETQHFGKIAYIEVGAMCVGKIVQTFLPGVEFKRGDEKGYFLFGGSTVIVLGQPGLWKPDADLLKETSLGVETRIQLGEGIASAKL